MENLRKEGDVWISEIDGARLVLIPEGPFIMGNESSDIFAEDDTKPAREVRLGPYFIDVFPVTNRQYRLFLQQDGYTRPDLWDPEGWVWKEEKGITRPLSLETEGFGGDGQPAAGVSWYEARAYCRWARRRLPTEAQWEKAARGSDGRRYPWGDELPHKGLSNFDSQVGRTTEAGAYPAGISPHGCEDMSGNVNNWCRDAYEEGEMADRGGGFATPFQFLEVLRCAARLHWPPTVRAIWNGFRTVVEA